jgi:hypothetical protein
MLAIPPTNCFSDNITGVFPSSGSPRSLGSFGDTSAMRLLPALVGWVHGKHLGAFVNLKIGLTPGWFRAIVTDPIPFARCPSSDSTQRDLVDRNIKRTYHALIVIEEAMMQRAAVETLREFAELVSLGAFLTMIALAARAFGA